MVLPLLMYGFETAATKETSEPLWPLQVPVYILVEEKRWFWGSAGIVQSCIRYTKLTIQPYLYTLMSGIPSWINMDNASSYLERFKIKNTFFRMELVTHSWHLSKSWKTVYFLFYPRSSSASEDDPSRNRSIPSQCLSQNTPILSQLWQTNYLTHW